MFCIHKCLPCGLRNQVLQRRSLSVYTSVYRMNEDDIKAKLQQLRGGSIDLQKDQNGVATLMINHPERKNAFSGTMMLDLRDRVEELEHWTNGKGLILRGADNTFCSGSDLNAVKAMSNPEDGLRICMFMQNTLTRLLRLPLVSVALVQGKALGGGAEVTTACDFRLMTSGSEIRFVHKHMGLTPGWGGATRLIKLIGYRNALKLLSNAQPVDPATGLKIGLADELLTSTDGDSCLEEAENWLNQYTNGSSQVIRAIKNVVVSGRELSQDESLKNEKSIFGTLWGSPANLKALAQKIKRN
ncbi:ethylmalonyl-CoA decarboxylase isoform X1 [Scyliorhinus canicula]|uniref:ethylmalonyl-CoA decarboxylase isoform X1 n=1 Tax=Scyliorhinus canicula TaxID=7830 RepID=UPI0018F5E486|nr:ethylmalonyl-CoA decarboxylase isoform X1 [Scyliorhinus canicula]XP_038655702.1 ethylmalonyl-CoA decarboxylase isoform X1 [Scyliorhinus canicula]XP_038655703.1 ethylmalonyl-CoA decarboxylase isoform X1 [Scyliorhinus canicula]